jgi:hypothetical protein
MKRLMSAAAALALIASIAGPVSANAPSRYSDHYISIGCGFQTQAGTSVFFGATASDTFGPDASLDAWSGEPFVGPPDLTRDLGTPVTLVAGGGSFTGTIPLVTGSGDPAGSATFVATYSAAGDPFVFTSFKDGNRQVKVSGQDQPLNVDGTLTLPGEAPAVLAGCFGDEVIISEFDTNPQSYVASFESRNVGCDLTNANGDSAFLFADVGDQTVFIDATLNLNDTFVEAVGEAPAVNPFVASIDTYDDTGTNIGQTTISATLADAGHRYEYTRKNATLTERNSVETIDISGTLNFPGGQTFDLGGCVLVDQSTKIVSTNPSGPKPGGKVPANDKPPGAILLKPGSRTTEQTKGASALEEAPYPCLSDEGVDLPVGSTVWFKVNGTGSPITVDTKGSDYDTVAAAYTLDGAGGFNPIDGACDDDVPIDPVGATLQASITFDTVVGTTYYVQIGGFPGESFTYGNLRVAVR